LALAALVPAAIVMASPVMPAGMTPSTMAPAAKTATTMTPAAMPRIGYRRHARRYEEDRRGKSQYLACPVHAFALLEVPAQVPAECLMMGKTTLRLIPRCPGGDDRECCDRTLEMHRWECAPRRGRSSGVSPRGRGDTLAGEALLID
jgi:hypothetical protein